MKQIKDKVKCERAIEKLELEKEFDTQNLEFQIYQQEIGELLCQPCNSDDRLQIVIEGTVNIYHIRDDGSKYFIAMNEGIYLLGDMEFMNPAPCIYFVEAVTPVTVAVLSLKKYRNVLKQDVKFMNLIASTLAAKLGIAANGESVSASLKDRILNHLEDEKIVAKCGKGTYWLL